MTQDQDYREGRPELVDRLRAEIIGVGPITLARFMERALYEPGLGYYQRDERGPGRSGDFLTAPETHPFFGFTIARQIAECWELLGRDANFVIREYGPGVGVLAYDILAAISTYAPDLFDVVHYQLVDVNPYRMEDARAAMESAGLGPKISIVTPERAAGQPIVGVVLANEVVDALPFHQLVVTAHEFAERFVTWDESSGWFGWTVGPLSAEVLERRIPAYLEVNGISPTQLEEGSLLEVSPAAWTWMMDLASGLGKGFALLIDYGYSVRELYQGHRLGGLLRGYHAHTVTDDPFVRIGEQDLTSHVDFTWLRQAARVSGMTEFGLTTQGDFLAVLGMGDFLVEMQQDAEATIEQYYQTQAAVLRLIDPGGMGRFRILCLGLGVEESLQLAGM